MYSRVPCDDPVLYELLPTNVVLFLFHQNNVPNKYEIHIRRNNLLEDSFRSVLLSIRNPDILKTRLWVVFDGETGLDYGGVQRYKQHY